jgi:hypothetical protein
MAEHGDAEDQKLAVKYLLKWSDADGVSLLLCAAVVGDMMVVAWNFIRLLGQIGFVYGHCCECWSRHVLRAAYVHGLCAHAL